MSEGNMLIDENNRAKDLSAMISQTLLSLDIETSSDDEINYKRLYYGLFNGISLILENTGTYSQAVEALKDLQCKAEEAYISQ